MIRGGPSKEVLALRHRLRFLLQELDLPPGETLIGRSPDCLITLDDPLVSRRHGRFLIRGNEAVFEDLGSRNGSRVNGRRVSEPVLLNEGDRLRIGALELVYCLVPEAALAMSPTGHLRHCGECSACFPHEVVACPACGANARPSLEAPSDMRSLDVEYDWALYLLTGLVSDALGRNDREEAERLLRLALSRLDTVLASGEVPGAAQLDALMEALLMLMGQGGGSVALLQRVLVAYVRRAGLPRVSAMRSMANLAPMMLAPIVRAIDELIATTRSSVASTSALQAETIRRLELLSRELRGIEA